MATHGDYSPEARQAAEGKARAAGVFARHADVIVAALPGLPDGHVLIAVVDADHAFSGTHHVETSDIVVRVPELEGDGGYAMVFSAGTSAADVARRAEEMAQIARQRAAVIDRIVARRAGGAATDPD